MIFDVAGGPGGAAVKINRSCSWRSPSSGGIAQGGSTNNDSTPFSPAKSGGDVRQSSAEDAGGLLGDAKTLVVSRGEGGDSAKESVDPPSLVWSKSGCERGSPCTESEDADGACKGVAFFVAAAGSAASFGDAEAHGGVRRSWLPCCATVAADEASATMRSEAWSAFDRLSKRGAKTCSSTCTSRRVASSSSEGFGVLGEGGIIS